MTLIHVVTITVYWYNTFNNDTYAFFLIKRGLKTRWDCNAAAAKRLPHILNNTHWTKSLSKIYLIHSKEKTADYTAVKWSKFWIILKRSLPHVHVPNVQFELKMNQFLNWSILNFNNKTQYTILNYTCNCMCLYAINSNFICKDDFLVKKLNLRQAILFFNNFFPYICISFGT